MEDLDARLAAAEAELAELDEQATAKAETAEKLRKLEAAEREIADRKVVAAAEDEHGADKIAVIPTADGVVIVKRPPLMHYRKFANKTDPGLDDATQLALLCLVHPQRPAFTELVEKYPAVPFLAATAIIDLAAGRKADRSGKS